MTRKGYILIAAALARPIERDGLTSEEAHAASITWESCCFNIADALAAYNPRFDRERFLKACGVQL